MSWYLRTEGFKRPLFSGDILISGSADSTARSWSFDTGGCLKLFKGHAGAVTTMATDAVGKILFTAGADATIRSWNISTGQVLKVEYYFFFNLTFKESILFL